MEDSRNNENNIWDNIEVGDRNMNNSGHFFEKRKRALIAAAAAGNGQGNKENIRRGNRADPVTNLNGLHILQDRNLIDNATATLAIPGTAALNEIPQTVTSRQNLNPTESVNGLNQILQNINLNDNRAQTRAIPITSTVTRPVPLPRKAKASTATAAAVPNRGTPIVPTRAKAIVPNRATATVTRAAANARANHVAVVPKAHQFAIAYSENKKRQFKMILEQEKQQRQFISRKLPNFKAHHERFKRQLENVGTHITVPITPETLKTSTAVSELAVLKRQELIRQQKIVPVFTAKTAGVVAHPPFKPQLEHLHIEPAPFDLRVSARLAERREYDKLLEVRMAQHKLQKLREKERIEKEEVKALRKNIEFKANPNPFN